MSASLHYEAALKALRDASDAQLKKLYSKGKAKPEEEEGKSEENDISEDDMELLKGLMDD